MVNDPAYDIDPFWGLSEDFTIDEAAALIVGMDPAYVDRCERDTNFERNYPGLRPTRAALISAINAEKLRATLRYDAEPRYVAGIDNLMERGYWQREDVTEVDGSDGKSFVIGAVPNWGTSTIAIDDLREWLSRKNWRSAFFFPSETTDDASTPEYLDPSNRRYAPKLAAAVMAWQDVTDIGKTSPKAALTKWLTDHADDFGLSANGIEEAAKVANWATIGGSPKS
ncbi:MAG: hypothetical protein IPN78_15125 [Candidatus Accumulibacter sp.]|nr:hypothetical protein [Candidatus Accumulibacter propinquus]